ncbi:hypothetical protein A4H97_09795 [Niastella yeongjuensis]|uniref:Uncharacterized protein n=1 Tax=Niastella yeongjuensis TaxID=354355 RepID=A0A1V9EET9_9BACT|nr:hypothetical protein [Niastella yeongjuensis]OQP44648.1 hypothetical protein A4H97_09795 [Niastella yeongjuensis]SEO79961.1 hypothetical protein SAMN05660816_03582 [Niastella yeongjuensis]
MKKHEYLDLKMGIIDQYSMVIKRNDLGNWKNLGWLTYTEVGLPEGDEEADLVYGEMDEDETLIFNKPILLRDTPVHQVIGLKVKDVVTYLGTYGMGGPGFFGLLLSNAEFLTYAVWGAGNYVIINDRVVECSTDLYKKTRPWMSNFGGNETWDDLTTYISGSVIENITLTTDACTLSLNKSGERIEVNFVKNDIRLPRRAGRKRNAYKKGVISDYIVFQHEYGTLIV